MQSGEYVVNRNLPKIVRQICNDLHIDVQTFSDDWIIEMTVGCKTSRIIGYKFPLNDSVASTIAQDKVATCEMLHAHNISSVPHVLIRTKASTESFSINEPTVIKPLTGTSGHGVRLVNATDDTLRYMGESGIEAWAISPYLDIVSETRLIMLDGNVLLAYEKEAVIKNGLKMFNLGKGAAAHVVTPLDEYIELASSAMKTLNLRLVAVDCIQTKTGDTLILEVNDGIMMEYFSRMSDKNYNITKNVYQTIINTIFEKVYNDENSI